MRRRPRRLAGHVRHGAGFLFGLLRTDTRLVELQCSLVTLAWGIWVFHPDNINRLVLGSLAIALGLSGLVMLAAERPRWRSTGALLRFAYWLGISVLSLTTVPAIAPFLALMLVHAFSSGLVYVRLAVPGAAKRNAGSVDAIVS